MKKIAVLGITGSIGLSTVDVVRKHSDEFQIVLASSHKNYKKLLSLSEEFHIKKIVLTDESLKSNISKDNLYFGQASLLNLIDECDCDIVLNAVSGSSGLIYTNQIIESGLNIALANKESLVMAGHIFKDKITKKGISILPVDSEHSAIFQAIGINKPKEIKKLIVTASGGPFRTLDLKKFDKITPSQALKHPTWNMGYKVTIDSATMMNKALELIEAHWLFDMPYDKIQSIIHPQSIIHSLVEFIDGSIIAQLSYPTMKLPILIALSYPKRIASDIIKTNLTELPGLTFEKMDKQRYPLFFIGVEVAKKGDLYPTIMNAANEAAINLFIQKEISFLNITDLVKYAIDKFENIHNPNIETIINKNREVYEFVLKNYKKILK